MNVHGVQSIVGLQNRGYYVLSFFPEIWSTFTSVTIAPHTFPPFLFTSFPPKLQNSHSTCLCWRRRAAATQSAVARYRPLIGQGLPGSLLACLSLVWTTLWCGRRYSSHTVRLTVRYIINSTSSLVYTPPLNNSPFPNIYQTFI